MLLPGFDDADPYHGKLQKRRRHFLKISFREIFVVSPAEFLATRSRRTLRIGD